MSSDSQRRLLGYSMDAVGHAARLAQRLLAFVRVHRYTPEAVELTGIVHDTENFARHSRGAGMDFQVEPVVADLSTLCDRHALEQAFINLCINARDACGGHGAIKVWLSELTVSQERSDPLQPSGNYITLAVTDNGSGSGMEERVRERLFEPCFTTEAEGTGTGLGLLQVYGVVRQAGGFVNVESAPGAGTTITMAFPPLQSPAAD